MNEFDPRSMEDRLRNALAEEADSIDPGYPDRAGLEDRIGSRSANPRRWVGPIAVAASLAVLAGGALVLNKTLNEPTPAAKSATPAPHTPLPSDATGPVASPSVTPSSGASGSTTRPSSSVSQGNLGWPNWQHVQVSAPGATSVSFLTMVGRRPVAVVDTATSHSLRVIDTATGETTTLVTSKTNLIAAGSSGDWLVYGELVAAAVPNQMVERWAIKAINLETHEQRTLGTTRAMAESGVPIAAAGDWAVWGDIDPATHKESVVDYGFATNQTRTLFTGTGKEGIVSGVTTLGDQIFYSLGGAEGSGNHTVFHVAAAGGASTKVSGDANAANPRASRSGYLIWTIRAKDDPESGTTAIYRPGKGVTEVPSAGIMTDTLGPWLLVPGTPNKLLDANDPSRSMTLQGAMASWGSASDQQIAYLAQTADANPTYTLYWAPLG